MSKGIILIIVGVALLNFSFAATYDPSRDHIVLANREASKSTVAILALKYDGLRRRTLSRIRYRA